MSEGKLRQWCRDFKNGCTNVYYEERSVGQESRMLKSFNKCTKNCDVINN